MPPVDPFAKPSEIVGILGGSFAMGVQLGGLWRRRVKSVGDKTVSLSGLDLPEIFERIEASEPLLDLWERVSDAARRAATEEHQEALARVFANAVLGDDAAIDAAMLYERTLQALDGSHIRMLVELRHAPPKRVGDVERGTKIAGGFDAHDLAQRTRSDRTAIVPVVSVLVAQGVAEDVRVSTFGSGHAWELTEYGRKLAEVLGGSA